MSLTLRFARPPLAPPPRGWHFHCTLVSAGNVSSPRRRHPCKQRRGDVTIDKADTAWVLFSSALVLLMTAPGLALFYGGMVRHKNALTTLLHSFVILCLVSVTWVLYGY